MANGAARSWPVFTALVAVAALPLVMLAIEVGVESRSARTTQELVDNSLRSVALAARLRADAHELEMTSVDRTKLAEAVTHVTRDSIAYDPSVSSPAERAEWTRLQNLLALLQQRQLEPGRAGPAPDLEEVERTIDRLIDINTADATASVATIAKVHRRGLVAESIAGAGTVVLAFSIGWFIVRALRRERLGVQRELESSQDRRRELEAFAGRVAHDLRGPLAPVRGYADMLAEHGPQEVRGIGTRLQRGVDRMTAIIDDLLSLSTSGQFRPARTAVAPVVRDLIDDMREVLRDATIDLKLDECSCTCTPGVLSQIVGNLVSNAVKYRAPERPLALTISSAQHEDDVEIMVADNGRGMDDETRAHMFEPFYRGRDVNGVAGTGLGLAIVKRSIEALHGSYEVDSVIGQGTAVTVRLPAAQPNAGQV